jgi:hypothetical protein
VQNREYVPAPLADEPGPGWITVTPGLGGYGGGQGAATAVKARNAEVPGKKAKKVRPAARAACSNHAHAVVDCRR